MGSSLTDEIMIELLLNLYPPLTVDEIKKIIPQNSLKKNSDLNTILNELNSTDESAVPTLFKAIVLQKRGTLRNEMREKAVRYLQNEVGVDNYQMDRPIGKGKTLMNVDILGRKEAKDICAFFLDEDMDIDSFESFKTMLATILSYEKISPVEIFLISPQVEVNKELVGHIKAGSEFKYVKTSGTELNAQLKPIIYESEIPRTAILTIKKEDIFGDTTEIGKFSGSSFLDKEELKKFLLENYGDYGEGLFRCNLVDHLNNKKQQLSFDTTSELVSYLTEIVQTTRFEET
jgi:hypothetical protein